MVRRASKAIGQIVLVLALIVGVQGIAKADTLPFVADSVGDTFAATTYNFTGIPGGEALSATVSMTVTAFSSTSLTLSITLTNGAPISSLMSFGFGMNPDPTSVVFSDAADGNIVAAGLDSIPNTGAVIEVCTWAGNNCSGGPVGDGLDPSGGTDTFSLTLTHATSSSVSINPFGFKWQGGASSFECVSGTTTDNCGGTSVPEPASLVLLGLGALGLAGLKARIRRRS